MTAQVFSRFEPLIVVLDGLAATRKIRRLEGDQPSVPIVALTANAMPEDREMCLAAGMDSYLAKPFDAADLSRVLERLVNRD